MKKHAAMSEMAVAQLKGYIARLVKVQVKVNEAKAEMRQLYSEARTCGFNTYAMRQAVTRRAMEQQAAQSYRDVGKGMAPEVNDAELMYEAVLQTEDK